MADTLPTPSRWRRFRHRQAWLAAPFLLLAIAGLVAAIGGVLPGMVLLLVAGPIGLLCVLNARAGHRGGHSVRLVARDGATQLEFPSHGLGTALVLILVTVSLFTLLVLLLVYSWAGVHGSIAAGATAVVLAVVMGHGVYRLWTDGRSRGHWGWPAVRLGSEGVELAGPLSGWFMPWDLYPVPMPLSNGVLRLVPPRRCTSYPSRCPRAACAGCWPSLDRFTPR